MSQSLTNVKNCNVQDSNYEKSQAYMPKLRNTYIAALASFLHITVLGMVSAYSSPATVDMQKPGSRFVNITASQISWIASLPLLVGTVGNFLGGIASQKLGRKTVLMFISTPYLAGWLMIAYATSVEWIYVGRALTGFCSGVGAVTAPAYLVEISTTETRGLLTTSFQIAVFLGILIINALGLILRWSFLAILGAVIITIGTCLTYFVPESPHWLIRQSRNLESMKALVFLRGKYSNFNQEFREISDSQANQPSGGICLRDLLNPSLYKPLLIAVSLMFFQQFCGISVVSSYTVEIFQSSGSLINPYVCASVVAAVQLFAGAISSILMDKVGRKILYITSGSFIILSLMVLGTHSFVSTKNNMDVISFQWVPLVCFITYSAAYSIGYGPIPGVVIPEIVSIHSRSTVLSVAFVLCSFFGFVVSKFFDDMRSTLAMYGVYWTYAFFSFLGCLFCYFCMIETKGKSLQEINLSFANDRTI